MATAFQSNAFQNNAFQIEGGTQRVVGWGGAPGKRRRYRPEVLEELLRQQKESGPFTRERFEELIAQTKAKAETAKNKPLRKALRAVVEETDLIPEEIPPDPRLFLAMEAAVRATSVKYALDAARHAEAIVRAYWEEIERDDEEVFALLF